MKASPTLAPDAIDFDDLPIPDLPLEGISWVIVGGESGPRCRPLAPEWVRDIRAQCQRAGVAFFFKQWGGRTAKSGGRSLDGQTWDDMPAPLPSAMGTMAL